MRLRRHQLLALVVSALTAGLTGSGCLFDPPEGDHGGIIPPPPPPPPPVPHRPERLVEAIETIYNDRVRSASERLVYYDSLFAPGFSFRLQAVDVDR
jgi:hypothetical protein